MRIAMILRHRLIIVKDGQEEIKNKVSEMTEKKSGKKEDDYNELNG